MVITAMTNGQNGEVVESIIWQHWSWSEKRYRFDRLYRCPMCQSPWMMIPDTICAPCRARRPQRIARILAQGMMQEGREP